MLLQTTFTKKELTCLAPIKYALKKSTCLVVTRGNEFIPVASLGALQIDPSVLPKRSATPGGPLQSLDHQRVGRNGRRLGTRPRSVGVATT